MTPPLLGIRVIELATFVAVPACGALLADLGAEVIKVEVPWGELYRNSRPRMAGYAKDVPFSPPYQMDNRGKRSLALDLALPEAVDALHQIMLSADIILTNMLPSRLKKYGLDPESLRSEKPELIYARLSGYGPSGPEADAPAFDYSAFWARTGFMDDMHDQDTPPSYLRPGVGDHSAGLAMALGIVSALRTRDQNQEGQIIDISLQAMGFYINGNDAAQTLATGETPPKHNRQEPRNPLWNHYSCGDGRWLFLVMIESDRYWSSFTEAIDRPELTRDERFAGAVQRYQNSRALVEILDQVFSSKSLEEWQTRMNSFRLIWSPVLTLAEAVDDPSALAHGIFHTIDHPEHGSFRTVGTPIKMSENPMPGTRPAPEIGCDTEAVLRETGLDEDLIALLTAAAS